MSVTGNERPSLGYPAADGRRPARPGPPSPDSGPKGTHGAIIANGNLMPQTPPPLLELGPLAGTATSQQAADHDRQTAELARYKILGDLVDRRASQTSQC